MPLGGQSVMRLRMEAFAESLFSFRCLGKRRPIRPPGPDSDDEEARLGEEAPVEDNAALRILEARGLLDDLEAEWQDDEGWLDRVVCGTLHRKDGKGRLLGSKRKDFLGFMLLSAPAPVAAAAPEQPVRQTSTEGPFLWPRWSGKRPALRVDWLHLLPPSGTSAEPLESIDLGRLVQQPLLEAADDGEVSLSLDFGSRLLVFKVAGRLQASRWAIAMRAAVSSTLAAAAEPEGLELVKELQRFDRRDPSERTAYARHEQRKVLEDLAAQAAEEAGPSSGWRRPPRLADEQGLAGWVAQLLEGASPQASTSRWVEAFERLAAMPRALLRAAVAGDPRMDVLQFWAAEHHGPLCQSLELLWNARAPEMLPGEVARFAGLVDAYRGLLVSAHVDDPSLGPAVAEAAEVYGRRFFPSLADLAARVAETAPVRRAPDGRCSTSAPGDLLAFLGPACEAALEGPAELRLQAAKLVDGAVFRHQKALRARLQTAEAAGSSEAVLQLAAALVADGEALADRCGDLLAEARSAGELGEPGQLVAETFATIQRSVRAAAQAYCERLVTLALRSSGIVSQFGSPLSMEKVWQLDIKRIVGTCLTPTVAACQKALPEPWRSRFALQFLTRFVAFEIFLLLRVQGKAAKDMWFYSPQKAATTLQEQQAALVAAAASWLLDDDRAQATLCCSPLGDLASILAAPTAQLPTILCSVRERQGGAFNEDVAKRVLQLRPELSDSDRAAALATVCEPPKEAAPEQAEGALVARGSAAARPSRVPAPQTGPDGTEAVSAFQWASELEWFKEVCAPPSSQVGQASNGGSAARPAPPASTKSARKASVLCLDEFLASDGNSLEDFLAGADLMAADAQETAAAPPAPVTAGDDAEEEETYHVHADDSTSDTADERVASDDELEEDEAVRGYFFMYERPGGPVKLDMGDTMSKLLTGRFFSAAASALDAGVQHLEGGWAQRYFMIKRNMRSERLLCWYALRGDRVARGCLRVSDILEVLPVELRRDRICKAALVIRHTGQGPGGSEQLELRTPYPQERDFWLAKLELLRQREVGALARLAEGPRVATVLRLPPSLRIRDPDRAGQRRSLSAGLGAMSRVVAAPAGGP